MQFNCVEILTLTIYLTLTYFAFYLNAVLKTLLDMFSNVIQSYILMKATKVYNIIF